MNSLLQNPLTWMILSILCAYALVHEWEKEQPPQVYRAFCAVALFLNASFFGVTVVLYELTNGYSFIDKVLSYV